MITLNGNVDTTTDFYTKVRTMQDIEQLTNDIRKIISSPLDELEDSPPWKMLCSCLDVIQDTNCCLEAFLKTDINFDSCNQYLDDGNKYMYVYGTLQALFMQQDAIKHFTESLQSLYALDPSLLDPLLLDPSLKEIREIRNDSVGHPTKRDRGKNKTVTFNFIARNSIGNQGFRLRTAYADCRSDCVKDINIPNLITRQRDILMGVLGNVLETLKEIKNGT